mmetsp:Transcript_10553/g.30052  ORF Transcript_10553/g.30052 Transcript_10553/m.30052 type:complete len:371 (+) Transcript_10553:938-2050(+)
MHEQLAVAAAGEQELPGVGALQGGGVAPKNVVDDSQQLPRGQVLHKEVPTGRHQQPGATHSHVPGKVLVAPHRHAAQPTVLRPPPAPRGHVPAAAVQMLLGELQTGDGAGVGPLAQQLHGLLGSHYKGPAAGLLPGPGPPAADRGVARPRHQQAAVHGHTADGAPVLKAGGDTHASGQVPELHGPVSRACGQEVERRAELHGPHSLPVTVKEVHLPGAVPRGQGSHLGAVGKLPAAARDCRSAAPSGGSPEGGADGRQGPSPEVQPPPMLIGGGVAKEGGPCMAGGTCHHQVTGVQTGKDLIEDRGRQALDGEPELRQTPVPTVWIWLHGGCVPWQRSLGPSFPIRPVWAQDAAAVPASRRQIDDVLGCH